MQNACTGMYILETGVTTEYGIRTCLQTLTGNAVSLSIHVAFHDSSIGHILESINVIFEFNDDGESMRVEAGSCLVTGFKGQRVCFLMFCRKSSSVAPVAFLRLLLLCRVGPFSGHILPDLLSLTFVVLLLNA